MVVEYTENLMNLIILELLNSVLGENLDVDGIFGGGTQRALITFQNKYGLSPDGIYGKGSEGKMRELLYK